MLPRMDIHHYDAIVIGAGIAGATAAAHLSADRRLALIEAEEVAGYHSTGRSAAIWILNYGPPAVRTLNALSRPFFEHPPEGFAETPLMSRRAVLFLAQSGDLPALHAMLANGSGLREIGAATARELVPAIRAGVVHSAAIEDDAFDMEVATLHHGFLRQLRQRGGVLALRSRSGRIERRAGHWEVEVTGGARFRAPVVVNAAGAWGDEVASRAGAAPLGLVPRRRTGVIIDAAPWSPQHWPMMHVVQGGWYARAEARTRLMVSPEDETDMTPHDVQPDELDVALGIDRMQRWLDIEVRRIEHSWAGLRTFTPDRSLAIGWDGGVDGFCWCVGQGGYGIQTSPAAGQLVADIVAGRDPGAAAVAMPGLDPRRFARAAIPVSASA